MRRVLTMKTTTHFIVMLLSISLCTPLTQAVPSTGQESLPKKNDARRGSIIPPQQIEAELANGLNGAAAIEQLKRDGQYESLQAASLTIDPLFNLQQKLSVAIDADTVVVGAQYDNIGSDADQGSAYVFKRSGALWTLQQKLLASNGKYGDTFGSSVAISGDMLVVGAENNTTIDGKGGMVYVFTRNGAVWTERQKLTASDGGGTDMFGNSVGLSGDTLVVGAVYNRTGSNTKQGAAYVFTRSGAVWAEQQKLIASDGAAQDYFGHAVAIDEDTVVAGAPRDDIDANSNQGSVYVFFHTITPPCPTIEIDPQVLPNGAMGVAYSETLTATGGGAPYTFVAQNELPPGLSLAANGVVSGVPIEEGQFNFRILVTDANGCATSRDISINIEKAEL